MLHLPLLFHMKDYVSYKKKLDSFQVPSAKLLCIIIKSYVHCNSFLLSIFSYCKVKQNVKYFFFGWFSDHGLSTKNNQQWETFQILYNITMFKFFIFLPTYQLWRHNILYVAYISMYLIFPACPSHSIFLKLVLYTKRNLTCTI